MGAALDQKGGSGVMRKKLRSARGETLVEVLCAILIGALSVSLLFSTVMVSIRIDQSAKAADESLATDLSNAEVRGTDNLVSLPDAKLTVRNNKITTSVAEPSVKFYGGGSVISYALEPEPAPEGDPP